MKCVVSLVAPCDVERLAHRKDYLVRHEPAGIRSEVDDLLWYEVRWNLWMFIYEQELDSLIQMQLT